MKLFYFRIKNPNSSLLSEISKYVVASDLIIAIEWAKLNNFEIVKFDSFSTDVVILEDKTK